ncbi:MAG: hypothetical protein L0H63_12770, partial [Nitrococcus sp.]|nr:hypothetical protein [Nitrococcus sp.]
MPHEVALAGCSPAEMQLSKIMPTGHAPLRQSSPGVVEPSIALVRREHRPQPGERLRRRYGSLARHDVGDYDAVTLDRYSLSLTGDDADEAAAVLLLKDLNGVFVVAIFDRACIVLCHGPGCWWYV